jgi:YidC/Oxa1 family membrane protein insertase
VNLINNIMQPLYYAVSWVLQTFVNFFAHFFPKGQASGWAWALAIVGLVVVIRAALVPLFVRQIKAQRGLQLLQPEIKKIQAKYKDDRQKQAEELQKLYRETGTNPFASCLPIIVQMPFFFALYHVLSYGVQKGQTVGVLSQQMVDDAQKATIFGAPISQSLTGVWRIHPHPTYFTATVIVTVILIVAMTATTFTTQRQLMVKNMPSGADNPLASQQKILLYVFPFMFAIFGINFPIGVLIYWLTTNLWTMGQQFYVIRRNPAPNTPAYDEMLRRRKEKGLPAPGEDTSAAPESPQDEPPKPTRNQPKRQSRSKRRPKPGQPGQPVPGDPTNPAADPPDDGGAADDPDSSEQEKP